MDLSKLPRLSETDKHSPPPTPPSVAQRDPIPAQPGIDYRPVEKLETSAAEAWLSIAIGVIMLLVYPRFLQWVSSRIFGTHFNEFTLSGAVVPYPQVPEFWGDLGPTSFAFVLVFEGLVLAFACRRSLVWMAFVLTVLVTAFNLIYVVASYSTYGLAIISAVAVVFGVYIAMHQWKVLQILRA
jgi:hypothetical protein